MSKPSLTKELVDALQPRDREYVAWCGKLKGFGCRVYPRHPKTNEVRKTFVAQYDFNGKTRKVRIATYPTMTPEQARKDAKLVLANAQRGIDAAEAKAEKRREKTVSALCDEYMIHAKKIKQLSTLATDNGRVERHIKPLLGSMKIGDVKRRDIERFVYDVADGKKIAVDEKTKRHGRARVTGGQGAAIRSVRLLGGIFSYAIERGYLETNPRHGLKLPFKDGKRDTFLSPDELRRLGEALHEAETIGLPWNPTEGPNSKHTPKKAATAREPVSPYAIAAIRLLCLTGCRAGEILNLQWSHVDIRNGFLNLPTSKTGAKKVLIGAAARQVLANVPRIEGNPYVIAGAEPMKPRSDLKRPWKRIATQAGLPNLRLHDLRHSYASSGAASGYGLAIVGKLLGHASTATTERYSHYADDHFRRASDGLDSTIAAGLGLVNTPANVVSIKGAA